MPHCCLTLHWSRPLGGRAPCCFADEGTFWVPWYAWQVLKMNYCNMDAFVPRHGSGEPISCTVTVALHQLSKGRLGSFPESWYLIFFQLFFNIMNLIHYELLSTWHEIAHWNDTRSLKSLRFSYLSTRCRSVSSRFPAGVGHIHSLGDMVRRGAWRLLRVGRFEIPNSYWRSWNHSSNMLRKWGKRWEIWGVWGLKWQVGKGAR